MKGWIDKYQDGGIASPRKGVRQNPDGTHSSHLMRAEKINDSTWVGFPSLFQNKDESWKDMSEGNWMDAYEEAVKRGEVKDFGRDSIKALEYGKGSWKKNMQRGGKVKKEKESTLGSDTYTRMMNMITTFGGSAIGDVVEGISPDAADWLEKYTGGMIPHTTEEMMESNRGSGDSKLEQAGDAANSVSLGITGGAALKAVGPYISKALGKIKNPLKKLPTKAEVVEVKQVKEAVKQAKLLPFQPAEPIGNTLQIGSLMKGSKLEQQVNSKTGEIAVGNIKNFLNNKSVTASDKRILSKVLEDPKFAGKKRISYDAFKEASSNNLVKLEGKQYKSIYDNYGTENLGYPKEGAYKPNQNLNLPAEQLEKEVYPFLENKSYKYSNKKEFGTGNNQHGFGDDALGHSRVMVSKEESDVMHILESQSDAFQARDFKKNFSKNLEQLPDRRKRLDTDMDSYLNMRRSEVTETGQDIVHNSQFEQIDDLLKKMSKNDELYKGDLKNPLQKLDLSDNIQERLIQENMTKAVQNGQTKMRYPTPETAAKIQGYKKHDIAISETYMYSNQEQNMLAKSSDLINDKNHFSQMLNNLKSAKLQTKNPKELTEISLGIKKAKTDLRKIENSIKEIQPEMERIHKLSEGPARNHIPDMQYSDEHQTILKKYKGYPKSSKKLFGEEAKIITDPKGNTWYESIAPKSYKGKRAEIKAFKQGGVIEDDRGQWAHPGKVTKINSNNITMKGVNYPVLGISNTGAEKLMMPGEDYKFDGESVTEYPMAQKGKILRGEELKSTMDRSVANREANETPANTKIGMYMDEQSKTYRLMKEKEKYYNPKVEEDITTGDWEQDMLYKNQWLMNVPILGDKIKNKAKNLSKLDASSSRDAFDVNMVDEGRRGVYEGGIRKRGEERRKKYDNEGNVIKYKENNSPTLVNQYFSKEALYPTSKYKPTSDYLEFLPSYSVKGGFEDRLNEPVPGKHPSKDWTNNRLFSLIIDLDAQYGINSNNKEDKGGSNKKDRYRRWEDFLKNKKPIYRGHYSSGSLSEMLDVNLAGHKTGLAWDKEIDLPYMSISDAWDFSPDFYSKKWGVQGPGTGMFGGSEEKRQQTKIQSALMHKAGNPFKVYDRFYFDPKTKKYITDKKVDSIRGVTKDKQWLDKY